MADLREILSGTEIEERVRIASRSDRAVTLYCDDPILAPIYEKQAKQLGYRVARKGGVIEMEEPSKGPDISGEHQGSKMALKDIKAKINGWRKRYIESAHLAGFRKASKMPRALDPMVAASNMAEYTIKLAKKLRSASLLKMGKALKNASKDREKAVALMERIAGPAKSSDTVMLRPVVARGTEIKSKSLVQDARDFAQTFMNRNSLRRGDKSLLGQLDQIGKAWEKSLALKGYDPSPSESREAWATVVDTIKTAARQEKSYKRGTGSESDFDAVIGNLKVAETFGDNFSSMIAAPTDTFDHALTSKATKRQILLIVGKLIEHYAPIQHPKRISEGDTKKFLVENYPMFATDEGLKRVMKQLKDLVDLPERHKKEDPKENKAASRKASKPQAPAHFQPDPAKLAAVRLFLHYGERLLGVRVAGGARRIVRLACGLHADMTYGAGKLERDRGVFLRELIEDNPENSFILNIVMNFPKESLPKLKALLDDHKWTRVEDTIIRAFPEVKEEAKEILSSPIAGKEKGSKKHIIIENEDSPKVTIGGMDDMTSLSPANTED